MEKEREFILVPCDFTVNAENALLHAIQLAKVANNRIRLVHIIKKGLFSKAASDDIRQECQKKLDALAEETEKEYGLKPDTEIREGRILKTIKEMIQEKLINLVIMSKSYDYGKSKLEITDIISFFKTSRMKKNTPIIAIQGPPIHNHYVEIVVPINYQKEFKETLRWVMHLSKYYKCNINFIKPFYSDPEKKKLMANNMYFTKKMLDNNNIVYGIKTAKRLQNYGEEIFRFAGDIDADLIVIMADKYKEYVLNNKTTNGHEPNSIPVMCIKPMPKKFQSFY